MGPGKSETLPINPAVNQGTIHNTVCIKGWTASIRPPVAYTNTIKKQRLLQQDLPIELISDFQLDHKLPLSLGGSPDDPHNLVLQDHDGAVIKDTVERCLSEAICSGTISLDTAQQAIWRDWRNAQRLCTVRTNWLKL